MNKKTKERKIKTLNKEIAFWQKEIDRTKYLNIDNDFKNRLIESCQKRIDKIKENLLTL